jgi:hypothetical protein
MARILVYDRRDHVPPEKVWAIPFGMLAPLGALAIDFAQSHR